MIESLIADHQTELDNSLFLSMRFRARRIGPYNEYLYTFFKCLAPDRLMYAEGWYAEQDQTTRRPTGDPGSSSAAAPTCGQTSAGSARPTAPR